MSGGERSIASLALQYSLSLASKSPILILDETDAFLDTGNVNRFLKLINNCLKSKNELNADHNIQVIVVTHKQGLFSKSESLVGVSRPKSLNLSQVYSLKLTDDWIIFNHHNIHMIEYKISKKLRIRINFFLLQLHLLLQQDSRTRTLFANYKRICLFFNFSLSNWVDHRQVMIEIKWCMLLLWIVGFELT